MGHSRQTASLSGSRVEGYRQSSVGELALLLAVFTPVRVTEGKHQPLELLLCHLYTGYNQTYHFQVC